MGRNSEEHRSYSEWRLLGCDVVVLCVCFLWVLCIKEFSDGGICSSNFRAAWKKRLSYWRAEGKCAVVLCVWLLCDCIVSCWNIRVCYWVLPYFICFAFLFETFMTPCMCMCDASVIVLTIFFWFSVLWWRVGGGRYTFCLLWRAPTVNFFDIFLVRAVIVLHLCLQIIVISCGMRRGKLCL